MHRPPPASSAPPAPGARAQPRRAGIVERSPRRPTNLSLLLRWTSVSTALWVGLSACGGPAAPRPPELDFDRLSAARGDARQGGVALRDRTRWRAGVACADCHAVPGATDPRPAPDIADLGQRVGPWWHGLSPTAAGAIGRCAERFGATPADAALPIADLLAALEATATAPTSTVDPNPAEDWRRLCAHCHDHGLGPALHGRPWPPVRFIAAVRHTDRPLHPASQMPAFDATLIDDARLAALAAALEAGALATDQTTPEVGNAAGQ